MSARRHVAVDLGASGGRVALGTIRDGKLEVEILHRFKNGGVSVRRALFWDVFGLWSEVLHGLRLAGAHGEIESVGVNSWGVDYGLLDQRGNLLEGVHHYRCDRNEGVMDGVLAQVGKEKIYEATGIQFMPINTVYQLLAHRRDDPELFGIAKRLLMVPDLLHYWLCGVAANERTIASTAQLLDPRTGNWSPTMLEVARVPDGLLGNVVEPGTTLGELLPDVVEATGLRGTKVVAPASHDTASAVAAVPAEGENWAYVSSGTWSLVGIETPTPVLTPEAMEENLTNEAGVRGTTRLLNNVTGLWILQECRRAWDDLDYGTLYAQAEAVPASGPTFDPNDARFSSPGLDMPNRVREAAGLLDAGPAEITRCIFDSLATKVAGCLDVLERVSGRSIETVHVVGGGSGIDLLNQSIADAASRTVVAGPVEATLQGNLLVQAEACGSIPPGSVRQIVREGTELKRYLPRVPQGLGA